MDRRWFLRAPLISPLMALAGVGEASARSTNRMLNLYVNSASGNDANDGMNPRKAKRTLQAAYLAGRKFNTYPFQMKLNLADSGIPYEPLDAVGAIPGAHIFHLVGNINNPLACRIHAGPDQNCISVQDYAGAAISGVYLTGETGSGCGIAGRQHTIVDYGNVAFGRMGSAHVQATDMSMVNAGTETIYGSASVHWSIGGLSKMNVGPSVNIPNALTFNYFLFVAACSMAAGSPVFTGGGVPATTGVKRLVQQNSVVSGLNNVPGDKPDLIQYGGLIV